MGPFVAEITYFTYYCANDKMELCKKKKKKIVSYHANGFHINMTALIHPVCCGRKKLYGTSPDSFCFG